MAIVGCWVGCCCWWWWCCCLRGGGLVWVVLLSLLGGWRTWFVFGSGGMAVFVWVWLWRCCVGREGWMDGWMYRICMCVLVQVA